MRCRLPLVALTVLALLVPLLALSSGASAADQLRVKSVDGDWAVVSGQADDEIGSVLARGVPKRLIRYAVEGHEAFSIGRRSGIVSYDGSAISAAQVSLTVTARDKSGQAASVSHVLAVSVGQPAQEPEPPPAPTGDDVQEAPAQPAPQAQTPATNTAPSFDAGETASRSVAENSADATNVGAALAVTNTENDTLTFALSGSDAFTVDGSGQIKVATGARLDHETTASYSVTVTVHDGKNAAGAADNSVDDTVTVTITVTNVDEAGSVTFSAPATPLVKVALTATLDDPDGSVSSPTWTWETADSAATPTTWSAAAGTVVNSGVGSSYTPIVADKGKWLRATVSYTDGEGSGKSAQAVVAERVTESTTDGSSETSATNLETNLVVDGANSVVFSATAATVSSIAITSTPKKKSAPAIATPDTYGMGEVIEVTVTFDKRVIVRHVPVLRLKVGNELRSAEFTDYKKGSGKTALVFKYTVSSLGDTDDNASETDPVFRIQVSSPGSDDRDDNGVSVPGPDPIFLPEGARIRSQGHDAYLRHAGIGDQSGHKVLGNSALDGSAPRISSISILSKPARGRTYGVGEMIEVQVAWDQQMRGVSSPHTTLSLTFGSGTDTSSRTALRGISSGTTSKFRYIVQAGDVDGDGISIPQNPLTVAQGDYIRNIQNNADAVLTYAGLAAQRGHRVNGSVDNVRPSAPAGLTASADRYEMTRAMIAAGKCDLPKTARSMSIGIPRIRLSWERPIPKDGTITGYQYRQRGPAQSDKWGSWTTMTPPSPTDIEPANMTFYVIECDITVGTAYRFQVRAVDAGGNGAKSDTASAVWKAQRPLDPTGLTGVAGNGQVTLSWDNPQDSSITRYEYRQRTNFFDENGRFDLYKSGFGTWTAIPSSGPSTVSHTVSGLDNGTTYYFQIRAVNAKGPSSSYPYAEATPTAQ